ncbi:MAG: hypothetical protein U9Q03_06365 [Patescibacteria group bacterium]|nr:hypothetical protein [Patescibacteria group bacterium]
MPDTDRKALENYLTGKARDPKLVSPAMKRLDPLFETAERGEFEFISPHLLDRVAIARVISHAIDQEVGSILAVSLSGMSYGLDICKEETEGDLWYMVQMRAMLCVMTKWNQAMQEAWSMAVPGLAAGAMLTPKEQLKKGFGDFFHHTLQDNFGSEAMEELGESGWYGLRASLEECIEQALGNIADDCLMRNFDTSFDTKQFRNNLRNNIWSVLFYFLTAVLTADTDAIDRLAPLVELLPAAIPLGAKKGRPKTWLVLTA